MTRYSRIFAVILSIILTVTTFTPYAVVNSASSADISLSAELSENGQYINFTLDMAEGFCDFLIENYGSDKLELYSLLPYETADDISYMLPIVSDISAASQIIRTQVSDDSLYRSYFLVAEKIEQVPTLPPATLPEDDVVAEELSPETIPETEQFEEKITYFPLTEPIYITAQSNSSANNTPYPEFTSKKGLDFSYFTDAQRLGVSHTVIDIPLNEYITSNEKSVFSSNIGEKSVYFDPDAITILDHKVKVYSDAGINIIFNFLLTPQTVSNEAVSDLYYTKDTTDNTRYYAINISNERGYILTRAAAEFFTSRYPIGSERGFVGSYIVGNKIDSNRNGNFMGSMPISEYVAEYSKLLRIFTTAAVTSYANAKVYISLGNSFASASSLSPDSGLDYAGRDILNLLNDHVISHGDIPWRVCVAPYASANISAAVWSDQAATDSTESAYLSMHNIGMLTKYLNQPLFYFDGQPRSLLIGELSFSSGGGAEYDEAVQAASYAYSYYKAETDPYIDALIYNSQVDFDSSTGGLYRKGISGDLEAKKIYDVFKYIDTDSSEQVTSFALELMGVQSWGQMITGCSASSMNFRSFFESDAKVSGSIEKKHISGNLFNLLSTPFYPSDNISSVEYGNGMIYARAYNVDALEYRGICNIMSKPIDRSDYIMLKIKVQGYDKASDVILRLSGYDKDGKKVVYEGKARISPNEETELYFPVKDYLDICLTDSMKIWARPIDSTSDLDYSFTVTALNTVTEGRGGGSAIVVIIIVFIIIAISAVACLILFFFTLPKKKSNKPKSKSHHRAHKEDMFE